jgi:hypothetical protein
MQFVRVGRYGRICIYDDVRRRRCCVTINITGTAHAPTTGACHLEIYELPGSDTFIQYGPTIDGSNCIGYFAARFVDPDSSDKYDLLGNTQRTFGAAPTSPFATGTYCVLASDGNCDLNRDSGTFAVIEQL